MSSRTELKICIYALALVAIAVAKPPPHPSLWTGLDKAAFSRSLGPPFAVPGMTSISVPYMPKSSPFFPKFVDPKTMISKKTDMLSNFINGVTPVDFTGQMAEDFPQYSLGFPHSVPVLYTPNIDDAIGSMSGFAKGSDIIERTKLKRDTSIPSKPSTSDFSQLEPGFVNEDAISSKHRRSFVETEGASAKTFQYPQLLPGFTPTDENSKNVESKIPKLYDTASTPKEMAPGMFGPFSPVSPYAAVTDIPIPKSTIVPPDFWLPSSIIPGPTEYTEKVSTFLSKLFDTIALNKTAKMNVGANKGIVARSLDENTIPENKVMSRSVDEIKTIVAAKDSIVDSILSELVNLKSDIIGTLDDFITYQKTISVTPGIKKPFKPLSPFAAMFAPPTPDPILSFKQKMVILDQVFDMLVGLQKNITSAIQDVINSSADSSSSENSINKPTGSNPILDDYFFKELTSSPDYPLAKSNGIGKYSLNATLLDIIKSHLAGLANSGGSDVNKLTVPNVFQDELSGQTLQKYPTSFWVAYPHTAVATAKRSVEDESQEIPDSSNNGDVEDRDPYKRLVQMQMHQGYQSMPLGTIESVQAGGGSVPGHQGGGIKLLIKMPTANAQEPEYQKQYAEKRR